MTADLDFIEYVAVPMPKPEDAVVVEEFKPYKGLEPFFDRVEALQTTKAIKSGLTLMLLEMDSALHAYKAGDMDSAVRHHEGVLNHSKAVFRNVDDLTGKSPAAKEQNAANVYGDVQKLFTSLTTEAMRGEKKPDGSRGRPQPWGHALSAIADGFRARQHALANLELKPVQDQDYLVFASSTRRMGVHDAFLYAANASAPKSDEAPWVCREYKNLETVLEAFQQKGSVVRKDAIVALSCLNAINRDEYNWSRAKTADEKHDDSRRKHFNEYHKRLDRYVHTLLSNKAISDGQKAGLRRFYKPAQDHAARFKGVIARGGALSRVFHAAASTLMKNVIQKGLDAVIGRKKPAPAATP